MWLLLVKLMLTTQVMLLLNGHILAYCCMLITHRYSGTRNVKILWSHRALGVNLLPCELLKKWLLTCDINFGCLVYQYQVRLMCSNNGVVKNASLPHSTLQKKHNAINYHAIREAVAAGILRVGKEDGITNLADLFTKVLTADRRCSLCRHIMY